MKKTILILLIIILSVGGIGLLLYTRGGGIVSTESIGSFFPFLSDNTQNENGESNLDDSSDDFFPDNDSEENIFAYKQIFSGPVVGFTYLENGSVRFMEKVSGNIYDYTIKTGDIAKISNNTILGAQEILWTNNGESFIVRALDEAGNITNTYMSFNIPGDATESPLYTFTKDLKEGVVSTDVKYLQITLNADPDTRVANSGAGSPGQETNKFGPATKRGVSAFQNKYARELPAGTSFAGESGFVGPITREKLNAINAQLFGKKEDQLTETKLYTKTLLSAENIIVNNEKNKIFYLENGVTNGVSGVFSNFDGSTKTTVFSSPFTDWRVMWPNSKTLTLNTKPSEDIPGSLYFVNIASGRFEKIISNVPGLTTLPNKDASKIFYAQKRDSGSGFSSLIFVVKDMASYTSPLRTLPEKCVWLPNDNETLVCGVPKETPEGTYPDSWYQGKISFDDEIYLLDTETEETKLLFDPKKETIRGSIDLVDPAVSQNGDIFLFKNKKDGSLWSLRLGTSNQ